MHLATEIQEQAGVLWGDVFGKYKNAPFLGERRRKLLNLKAVKVNGSGRRVIWVSKVNDVLRPNQTSGCNISHPIYLVGWHN